MINAMDFDRSAQRIRELTHPARYWSDEPSGSGSASLNDNILRGKRAVIAEDEGVTQLQLKKILESQGVAVVGLARNGVQAVEAALAQRPDFILMDVRMPLLDGLQASQRILNEFAVCIVVVTAFSDEEDIQHASDIGASGYITKPVTTETLVPRIKAALANFSKKQED